MFAIMSNHLVLRLADLEDVESRASEKNVLAIWADFYLFA